MKKIFLFLALVSSIWTYASSPQGIGVFSVSADKQVTFSPGNLQYHPATNQWRFASNQTELIGDANNQIAVDYDGWLDLFGWSTVFTYYGVSTSKNDEDYGDSFVDWGTATIGEETANTWRTLTIYEWDYLLFERDNASRLKGIGVINGVNGLILLPDGWRCPPGVMFQTGFYGQESEEGYAEHQVFTPEHWAKLEAFGAVFLPAAGYRYGSDVDAVQYGGFYWSDTEDDNLTAYALFFYSNEAGVDDGARNNGLSVRLVKDLQ
ncbi:MAG: hypothetical protein J6R26_08455 [Paludibacteraceae bacterium]|nr:hypothetical protein [Paludibacteraceae bacterium]